MGCSIDHTHDDVRQKLQDQQAFLPCEVYTHCQELLTKDITQEKRNELFHLLKKYDLASAEERERRNQQMKSLLP